MTVTHATRMRNRWRAYWVKLVMFSAVLVVVGPVGGAYSGDLLCPEDGAELGRVIHIENGVKVDGPLILLENETATVPVDQGFFFSMKAEIGTEPFESVVSMNTDPAIASVDPQSRGRNFFHGYFITTLFKEGTTTITWDWMATPTSLNPDPDAAGSCSLIVIVGRELGSIQGQLHSAEPLEPTDGVDVQEATIHLFQQDATVREQTADELIDDYFAFLEEAGRTLVDTVHVTPENVGEAIFRDLPLVDDADAPANYTLQIEDARTKVQDPENPGMTRIVHFTEAAVPNLMAAVGDPVTTHEIRLTPLEGFEVNSTGDAADADQEDGVCDTGQLQSEGRPECTLRAAIEQANARDGRDLISFNIPGPPPHTIAPTSKLPAIKDAVLIDGTTQPAFEPIAAVAPQPPEAKSHPQPVTARRAESVGVEAGLEPLIQTPSLDGSIAGRANGYKVKAMNVEIRGKRIVNFEKAGILLTAKSGSVRIEGNIIGIGHDGTAQGNGSGIVVRSSGNTIGGITQVPGQSPGNVISGNREEGIAIRGSASTNNTILGNVIGTDRGGTNALRNRGSGVGISGSNNVIGGVSAGAGNVISGNSFAGIDIHSGATGNRVEGNISSDSTRPAYEP